MKIQQGVMLNMLPIKNMASAAILYFFSILEKELPQIRACVHWL
jgi:hypothetical protein